ncbi:probable L-type lectin-domain containing receptor kinase, partial [Olea europaea subsp. europaea]
MGGVLQILNNEAELMIVPKAKPTISFSNSLPLSIDDIVLDCEDSVMPESQFKIRLRF